jgi:hypothetical protein
MRSVRESQKRRKDEDMTNRIIGVASEEVENVADSIVTQVAGNASAPEGPITEVMQQKPDVEKEGENEDAKRRKFIRTREELDDDLKKQILENQKKLEDWKSGVEEGFKIVNPGEKLKKER